MRNLPKNLYYKIQQLSDEVQQELRKKGVVAPVKNDDGTISVGRFTIVKTVRGYEVLDPNNDVIVSGINLPQTAILVANNLALGRFKDNNVIDNDRRYGYALFEEELHNRAVSNSKKRTLEYFDVMSTKAAIAKYKKEQYKRDLLNKYEKLIQLV